ncbi:MAG: DUF1365 domain-containing protein [Burkholderiaceae bacterium]
MSAAVDEPLIGIGRVRHERLRPVPHRFEYPTYFLMLPMRRLRDSPHKALARNRFGLIGFHDADHGDGGEDSLAWLESVLAAHGVTCADGEIWLHCYPRVLGFVFKPVSFWYCRRRDGTLAAVLVEVNNTFGERHCYLLRGPGLDDGREVRAAKVFHVSPFCAVQGDYRFRFARGQNPLRTLACIDLHDAAGALLRTSVSGRLHRLTPARIRGAFFGMPLMTFGVIARIHWQAARLWAKRVPWFGKPAPPADFVSD